MHKDGLIFESKNLDTYHVVPNCYETQIPKFPLLTWRRASENGMLTAILKGATTKMFTNLFGA